MNSQKDLSDKVHQQYPIIFRAKYHETFTATETTRAQNADRHAAVLRSDVTIIRLFFFFWEFNLI